ncbi:MAG: hypothetical protein RIR70_185, partial [Pseudomonadota bacterium]
MFAIKKFAAPLALGAALSVLSLNVSAQQTLTFNEVIGPSLQTITPVISSAEAGIEGEEFIVIKEILNNSQASWHDFHVHLESLIDGQWT